MRRDPESTGGLQRAWASAPRRRWAHVVVVARHHAHVDDAYIALAHKLNGPFQRRLQLGEIGHRPDAERSLRAGHRREVDAGFVDALADPLVLERPAALARHALLVELVVVDGAVVGDDEQARDAVVRGAPE